MKKILITGLTGTSGLAFYNVLCREGYSKPIRVLVRKTTKLDVFNGTPLDMEFFEGDLNDEKSLENALEDCDMVFHIAAKGITRPLINAIVAQKRDIKVILVSSTIVYSQYYRTSYLKEDEADYVGMMTEAGLKYVFIRPTMIFGTATDKNISKFVGWFKKFPAFPIVKKALATIQPVHREDLAEGYWLILKNFDNLKQKEYIISGEKSMTLLEMFEKIALVLGKKVIFINVPFCFAKICVNSVYLLSFGKIDYREKLDRLTENRAYDHDAITEELGYFPHSFEERLRQMVKTL